MKRLFCLLALLLGATLATAATPPPTRGPAWASTVRVTPSGSHLIGNPAAAIKIVEYISYTCPHCSHFQTQAEAPMREQYLPGGKVSVEVRHLVRDAVDMTAALLANCGAPARFLGNHNAFLIGQPRWIAGYANSTDAQRKRWETGPYPVRMKAMASDLGFYGIMAKRGYTRAQADACLADPAMAKRLTAQTQEAGRLGIEGTPGFLINGLLLTGTYDWATLESQLQVRL